MEIFIIKAFQFILAISLLVLLHEAGHFFAARMFGIKVDKFYIFFDPWFHLFEIQPKKGGTRYGVGWLPLGGYCKIAGMIDESMDTEQLKSPPQPWEFRSKPAWQRLIVMIGGVTMNVITAFAIYSMVLFCWGESFVQTKDMTLGMKFNAEAKALGFQDGDILLGTNKGAFRELNADVYRDVSEASFVEVQRAGKKVRISLPGNLNLIDMLKNEPRFMAPFAEARIDSVPQRIPTDPDSERMIESPAYKAGLQKGDMLVGLNGKTIDSYNAFSDELGRLKDALAGAHNVADSMRLRTVSLVVRRTSAQTDTLTVMLTPEMKLGFVPDNVFRHYKTTHVTYTLAESLPAGVKYAYNTLSGYVRDIKYLFSGDGVKNLGGFGSIGSLFPATWDWQMFWLLTAFLSIALAFMNILPIPALDGGFVLFLLYEMITRRTPSERFMIVAEYVGFGLVILLMLVANLNDVLRFLGVM